MKMARKAPKPYEPEFKDEEIRACLEKLPEHERKAIRNQGYWRMLEHCKSQERGGETIGTMPFNDLTEKSMTEIKPARLGSEE